MMDQKKIQIVFNSCPEAPPTGIQHIAYEMTIGRKLTAIRGLLRPHFVDSVSDICANGISITPSKILPIM